MHTLHSQLERLLLRKDSDGYFTFVPYTYVDTSASSVHNARVQ